MHRIVAVFIALLLFSLPVFAHDAWVNPGPGPAFKVLYGHLQPEPYPVSKVSSLKVFTANKKELPFARKEASEGLTIIPKGRPALFALEFDNGYWIKVAGEKERKNVQKADIVAGSDVKRPIKISKTILRWQPWMFSPLGQRIEFIPQPFSGTPRAGGEMKLQLLLDGKPLAGQMVENNSNETGPKTDDNGMVTVTLTKGMQRFATDYNVPKIDSTEDLIGLTAVLVFVAK